MNIQYAITQMETNAQTIKQLTVGISEEQAHWKPDDETWSMVEVMNHMVVEDRWDFRKHLAGIVSETAYDDLFTVSEYDKASLHATLTAFLEEREASLAWLRDLPNDIDWETRIDMDWGHLKAGDMLASWVAHDILHMRQLVELHFALTTQAVQPYSPDYAGDW